MSTRAGVAETSVGFGVVTLAIGLALWLLQFSVGVFASWGWTLLVGSAWMILGLLLLFPDVRLYTGARPPAEAYYESASDRPTAESTSSESISEPTIRD